MVASKYLYDEGEDEEVFNDDWAKAGKKLTFFCFNGNVTKLIKFLTIKFAAVVLQTVQECLYIATSDQTFCLVFRKQNCE